MSSLDLELDGRIADLELDWRQAHEASSSRAQNTWPLEPTFSPTPPP